MDLVQEKEEASPPLVPSELVRVLELNIDIFQDLLDYCLV